MKKATVSIKLLLKLCELLEYNFFADLAATLPESYKSNGNKDKINEEKITALALEIQFLEREKNLLQSLIHTKINPE